MKAVCHSPADVEIDPECVQPCQLRKDFVNRLFDGGDVLRYALRKPFNGLCRVVLGEFCHIKLLDGFLRLLYQVFIYLVNGQLLIGQFSRQLLFHFLDLLEQIVNFLCGLPGCVPVDQRRKVFRTFFRSVRKGRKLVVQEDLLAAFELVIAGTEKKGSVLTEFEKKLVAYHEVGHAMVAYKQKNAEPVQKITIVPHTQGSLGYTLLMPEEDKTNLRTKEELMAKIAVSMGGRAAEEVVLNTMTNGASQDIQEATNIARNMVAMFGMSDQFGMMALASRRSQYLDGGYGIDCAQDTAARMDQAVKAILDKCYADAVQILKDNSAKAFPAAQLLI